MIYIIVFILVIILPVPEPDGARKLLTALRK